VTVQHVILEVCGGKLGGTKRALAPGQSVKVGRRAPADLVVADDAMSAPHFEVAWDGAACTVRDLKSAKGTLVGGEAVAKASLANGAWIRAGATDFLVSFECATPPSYDFDASLLAAEEGQVSARQAAWLRKNRGPELAKRAARDARAEAAKQALSREPGKLYAVLDSARSPRIRTLLRESIEACQSLYDGVEGEALAHVAPYLVELGSAAAGRDRASGLLGRLLVEGWERRWASYFTCDLPLLAARRHLRRFLVVADADTRERFYFRFYDPVVLRTFLVEATPHQRAEIFGPVRAFFVEGQKGELARFDAPAGEAS
jgi:pSer/pThr/pTyr-binding forkhead associated (FHA) protein